ncbi:hypothetical protein [Butyrivibrio sp. AE3004]|uniref:hypothetical protein n=1 Tax=Butyrivibrio sp. AE3004 TaxID=1506994 RepID=UPI0004945260|nr:hypothetical protein [Butyrivibrio sp. AE3004]
MKKKIISLSLAIAATLVMTASFTAFASEDTTKEKQSTETAIANDEQVSEKEQAEIDLILNDETKTPEDKALELALRHAEYSKEEAEEVVIEKDEKEEQIISVSFYVGVSKFDYKIDITTGKIIEYTVDD